MTLDVYRGRKTTIQQQQQFTVSKVEKCAMKLLFLEEEIHAIFTVLDVEIHAWDACHMFTVSEVETHATYLIF